MPIVSILYASALQSPHKSHNSGNPSAIYLNQAKRNPNFYWFYEKTPSAKSQTRRRT